MREHLVSFAAVLSDGDRAALQGLIPLAGAVGAGTIFSLFAGGRRGTGFRVFEVFAIVAVLTAAALTAALSIDQLHANEAISSRDLTQTAMPLVIATLLLVVISVFERVSESWDRALVLIPCIGAAIYAAGELTISSWNVGPGSAMLVVLGIFVAGLLLAGLGLATDRFHLRSGRRSQQNRVRRLVELGYAPARVSLAPALPRTGEAGAEIGAWTKGGATLLDYVGAEHLRDLVRGRWDALAAGEAEGAVGEAILLDVRLQHWIRRLGGESRLCVTLLRPQARVQEQTIELPGDEHRLYDVSRIVAAASAERASGFRDSATTVPGDGAPAAPGEGPRPGPGDHPAGRDQR
ncbi:MAG TPA: hypothetical protein VMF55_13965 [Solirubrobacterales bacterium]|nr:hypothetical protein [Solirubrobacterales bacterium]